MKVVSDKKKRKHLAGPKGPILVDVMVQSQTSGELEDYRFTPAAVRRDGQGLPQARGSPYDDQDGTGRSEWNDDEDEDEGEESAELDDDDE